MDKFFVLIEENLPPNSEKIIAIPYSCNLKQVNTIGSNVNADVVTKDGQIISKLKEGMILLREWQIRLTIGGCGADKIYIICEELPLYYYC